jgi:uncharacterized RDD family membrane protein YckC
LTEEEFAQRVEQGVVQAETLVWNETMANWQPYGQVRAVAVQLQAEALATGTPAGSTSDAPAPLRPAVQAAAAPGPAARASALAAPETTGAIRCGECGVAFPPDEVVPIAGQWVCAGCKPLALQKLREGVAVAGVLNYAGFWIRCGARLIDWIILFVPTIALVLLIQGVIAAMTAAAVASGSRVPVAITLVGMALMVLLLFGVQAGYTVFFLGRYGATPGKMACGLRVVRSDGSAITYGRATGRFFADLLNGWTFYIGYLIAAFDAETRALHDHICDTRVVYK